MSMDLTWKCESCGAIRPDEKISVHSADTSDVFGLPPGTSKRNVNYCNDKPECHDGAMALAIREVEGMKASKAKRR